jgi:hypothetical protein
MKPVMLTELETHLVAVHNVSAERISILQDRWPDKRAEVAKNSHALMHMAGFNEDTTPHTHPEFEVAERYTAEREEDDT